MKKKSLSAAVVGFLLIAGCGNQQLTRRKQLAEPMLAHNVFLTLKDDSGAARQRLIDACYRLLRDHPGVVFFAAGPLAEQLDRAVNVRDFHVGLHIVFSSEEFHDEYQISQKHLQFIKENADSFEQVRVFDTLVR